MGSLAFEKVAERPGITWHRSGHPTCEYFEEKNWPKTGPPNLGFGVRNGPKMVKIDPNAYNLREVKLFDQLLPTFH